MRACSNDPLPNSHIAPSHRESVPPHRRILTLPADARGGHGFGGRGAEFAGGHHHGNDSHIKAASDEREKLLDTKLKSICRGC